MGISISRFAGDRGKKFYAKSIYFALPAALTVILIFLAGAGPMTRIAAWLNLAFVKTEAAAKPEGGGAAADSSAVSNPPEPREEKRESAPLSPDASKETQSPGPPVIEETPAVKTGSLENGETLYSLLRRSYNRANATLLDYILEMNPEIVDPNLVLPHERIRLPILAEESLVRQSAKGTFRIHLATFAKKEFAERYKSEETLKGRVIRIEDRRVSSQETWYRVFADGFQSREDGQRAVKILRGKRLLPIFAGES